MAPNGARDVEIPSYQALLDENSALKDEVQNLRARLEEAEELRRAISEGDIDALVIPGPEGNMIFTLDGADHAYRVLVETMNEGTATLACDGTIHYCNLNFADLLGMPIGAIMGTPIYRFIVPEDRITFEALLKHKISKGEINFQAYGDKPVPVYLSISSLKTNESPSAWCLVVTDLTEQKKSEEVVASEKLARSIIEQTAEAIIICDTSGRITRFSNAVPDICGCDPTFQRFEDLINVLFSEGSDAGIRILPVSSALKGSAILGVESTFERRDGQRFHLLLNSGPLKNTSGEIIGCVATLTDITERKLAEEMLLASLKEKEVLLKEVHHRVKNNLQVVSSLLNLQSKRIKDKGAAEAFKESQNRIMAMSFIHEKLYRSSDLSSIKFAEYAKSLARSLQSYYGSGSRVHLRFDMEDLALDIDRAIPCGLIINELLSNSLKHAFPNGRSGNMSLEMHLLDGREIVLSVRDDGIGLPPDLEQRMPPSLGLILVRSLVAQIKGRMEVDGIGGTQFKIVFPAEPQIYPGPS